MTTTDENSKKYAVALGFFDGLHSAHMRVIAEALNQRIEGFIPAILLFDKHPQEVLSGRKVEKLLQDEKRDEILGILDVKIYRKQFLAIKDMSPEDFVKRVLASELNAGFVCCGYNYRFGKGGEGTAKMLVSLCEKYSIKCVICPEVKIMGETVSSTAIRKAIAKGDIKKANRMLGRQFSFATDVFSGDHRGRLLGAPTINQYLPKGYATPKFAVYASTVMLDGIEWPAVTNIGNRPTFDGSNARSETYILGFAGNLYGKTLEVRLYDFIRGERKFGGTDELKAQIALDVKASMQVSSNYIRSSAHKYTRENSAHKYMRKNEKK